MKKIHTKIKRKYSLTTSFRHRFFFSNVIKKKRPKTFKCEEAAKAYAEKHGIKNYELVNLRSPESSRKKIRIVVKE